MTKKRNARFPFSADCIPEAFGESYIIMEGKNEKSISAHPYDDHGFISDCLFKRNWTQFIQQQFLLQFIQPQLE